jgi:peptidoglycan hydrolase-like protein with peptidoglycan-binding domain
VKKVKLLVKGGTPLGIFPGVVTAYPLSVAYLKTPNVTAPKPPRVTAPPVRNDVRSAQQRLADLGYLLPTDVDGQAGPATLAAVIAFQKWEGLDRDGKLGPVTNARLRTATRPKPITRGGPGRRIEILLDRQVALAIDNNRVVRVIHISSGAPATPTPTGNFAVYAKYGRAVGSVP